MRMILTALALLVASAGQPQAQQLLESYTALLSRNDHYNSNGQRLTEPWQIIRQDRANFHRYGAGDPQDDWDSFFSDFNNRARAEQMLLNGYISAQARNAIVNNDAVVSVEIWGQGTVGTSIRVDVAGGGTMQGQGETAVSACPNPNQPDNYSTYQFTGDQLFQKRAFDLQAGGDQRITNCSNVRPRTDTGDGYVTSSPDFSFTLSGMNRYSLVIGVISQCDSVLLINTGSVNWYYDDDDNGNADARINLSRPANGRIDVWVGTYDGTYCDATLSLETFYR